MAGDLTVGAKVRWTIRPREHLLYALAADNKQPCRAQRTLPPDDVASRGYPGRYRRLRNRARISRYGTTACQFRDARVPHGAGGNVADEVLTAFIHTAETRLR